MNTLALPRRIAEKIDTSGDCWLWTAATANGYGRVWDGRTMASAHRLVYTALAGPIPDGLHLDHLCRNRRCVNPSHLEPVTQAVNNRRAGDAVTHCPRGHAYTPENTIFFRHPKAINLLRKCRSCKRERDRARQRTDVRTTLRGV